MGGASEGLVLNERYRCVLVHLVCVPAEAASTLSLSAVVVPQSNVSLVQQHFTETALKGVGPQRRRALMSHKQLLPVHLHNNSTLTPGPHACAT